MLSTSALSFRGLAMALALVAGVAVVSDASAMSRKERTSAPWSAPWSVAWPATCSPTVIPLPLSAVPWPAARSAT